MVVKPVENNGYTKKPSKLNNLVTGTLVDLKLSVPVLSQHTVGDFFSNQKETAQNLLNVQDGKENGALKKVVDGAVKQFVFTLPVIGTYKIGKAKVNHDILKYDVDAHKYNATYAEKKPGVIKTYFKGLIEKMKFTIPVYNTYYAGKIANESKNTLKDSQIINAKNN